MTLTLTQLHAAVVTLPYIYRLCNTFVDIKIKFVLMIEYQLTDAKSPDQAAVPSWRIWANLRISWKKTLHFPQAACENGSGARFSRRPTADCLSRRGQP